MEKVIDPKYWKQNCCQHQQPVIEKSNSPISDHSKNLKEVEHRNSSPEISHRVLVDNRSKESRTKPAILLRPDDSGRVTKGCQHATGIHTDSSAQIQHQDSPDSNIQSSVDSRTEQHLESIRTSRHDGKESVTSDPTADTWIYPLVQMGPIGITVDEEVTSKVLESADSNMECFLASGYFNLTRKYMDIVLSSKSKFNILMASPQVSSYDLLFMKIR